MITKTDVPLRCICNEKIILREPTGLIVKTRILKVTETHIDVKCKRCGNWLTIPRDFSLDQP
ncbi:MAG: hypothetical protein OEV42_08420 [Deltaproteobacteria bacterium]|nr:hypothetical protein [Deltaproteobacteria bacterium]